MIEITLSDEILSEINEIFDKYKNKKEDKLLVYNIKSELDIIIMTKIIQEDKSIINVKLIDNDGW